MHPHFATGIITNSKYIGLNYLKCYTLLAVHVDHVARLDRFYLRRFLGRYRHDRNRRSSHAEKVNEFPIAVHFLNFGHYPYLIMLKHDTVSGVKFPRNRNA